MKLSHVLWKALFTGQSRIILKITINYETLEKEKLQKSKQILEIVVNALRVWCMSSRAPFRRSIVCIFSEPLTLSNCEYGGICYSLPVLTMEKLRTE